eukprot:9435920-Heterocapsa_arctica.AAC.1
MDMCCGDEDAWEAHIQVQIQNHEQRVRELREQGLRRVGLGSSTHPGEGQSTIDLTEEPPEDSQETEAGSPNHVQETQQGNPVEQLEGLDTEHREVAVHEEGRNPHRKHKASQTD